MKVKLLGFDDRGKVRLSMKQVDQATGEDLVQEESRRPGGSTAGLEPLADAQIPTRADAGLRGRFCLGH